jgi:predicted nucleic acid-binding Zn ribbon protein
MPIYCYVCGDCGYSRDLLLKSYKDCEDTIKCDQCESLMSRSFQLEKPSFVLVGGCWAKQGYEMSDRQCLRENELMLKEDKEMKPSNEGV